MSPSTPLDLFDRLLATPENTFPLEVLTEIRDRLPEMVPEMLEILAHSVIAPEDYNIGSTTWMLPMFSALFLAEAREPKAFPLLITLLHLPEEEVDTLFGESITEDMHRILASCYDGNETLLRELVENPEVWEFTRACCGLGTFMSLLHSERIPLATVSDYFTKLMRGGLEDDNDVVWSSLACHCGELGLAHLIPDIEAAYESGKCDPTYENLENVVEAAANGGNPRWRDNNDPITDTIALCRNWACFQPEPARSQGALRSNIKVPQFIAPPLAEIVRSGPKIGRNDPCPCASGKKYKKCCGA